MKTLFIILSLILITGFISTHAVQAKSNEPTQNNSQTVMLDMQNMTCAMCSITIRKALEGVDGVQSTKVDFDSKTANVTFYPQKTNIETLLKTTTNAGYPATVHPEN